MGLLPSFQQNQRRVYFSFQANMIRTVGNRFPQEYPNASIILTEHKLFLFPEHPTRKNFLGSCRLITAETVNLIAHRHLLLRFGYEVTLDITGAECDQLFHCFIKQTQIFGCLPLQISTPHGTEIQPQHPFAPSQEFQLLYSAGCTSVGGSVRRYFAHIPAYYHVQVAYGNHSFDANEVQTLSGKQMNPSPVLAALARSLGCGIFSISHCNEPKLLAVAGFWMARNAGMRVFVATDLGATDGITSFVMPMGSGCQIRFWDLSSNKLSDMLPFIEAFKTYQAPLRGLVFNDMSLSDKEIIALFDSLTTNPKTFGLKKLSIIGSKLNSFCCRAFAHWLETLGSKGKSCKLQSVGVGPVSDSTVVCLALSRISSLVELRLVNMDLTNSHEHLARIMGASRSLRVLDFSCSRFSETAFDTLGRVMSNAHRLSGVETPFSLNFTSALKNVKFATFLKQIDPIKGLIGAIILDNNPLTVADLGKLVDWLEGAPHFYSLSINGIFSESSKGVDTAIVRLFSSTTIRDLSITGEGKSGLRGQMINILQAATASGNLRSLDISHNKIDDDGMRMVLSVLLSNTNLEKIVIDDLGLHDPNAILAFLIAYEQSKSLIEAPFPDRDAAILNAQQANELRVKIAWRLKKNQYLARDPITSPLMLRKDLVLSSLIRKVTVMTGFVSGNPDLNLFSRDALSSQGVIWAPGKEYDLKAPIAYVLGLEHDPDVRAARVMREARPVPEPAAPPVTCVVHFHFEDFAFRDLKCEVNAGATIDDLRALIGTHYSDFASFDLYYENRLLQDTCLISELGASLQSSVVVRNVRMLVLSTAPVLYYCLSQESEACPLPNSQITLAEAKSFLSPILNAQQSWIVFRLAGEVLENDDQLLDLSRVYSISVMKQEMTLTLHFLPSEMSDSDCKLIQNLTIDIAKFSTFKDLSNHLIESGKFREMIEFSFSVDHTMYSHSDPLNSIPNQSVISIRYAAPHCPTTLRFAMQKKNVRLVIDPQLTIRDVKWMVWDVFSSPNSLPGLTSLTFFGCVLNEGERIGAYGIPDDSLVDVHESPASVGMVCVHSELGDDRYYHFSDSDTVGDVNIALRKHRGDNSRNFQLVYQKHELFPTLPLSRFNQCEIELIELFEFRSVSGELDCSIPLRANATLQDGRDALCLWYSRPPNEVTLMIGSDVATDFSMAIWPLSDQISFELSFRSQVFFFQGQTIELKVNGQMTICDLKPIVCREFGIVGSIEMYYERAQLDEMMTIDDLDSPDYIEIKLSVQSPDAIATMITFVDGESTQSATFNFPLTATLFDVEPKVREQFAFDEIDLDFCLSKVGDTEIKTVSLPKSMSIQEIHEKNIALMVRSSPLPDERAPSEVAPNCESQSPSVQLPPSPQLPPELDQQSAPEESTGLNRVFCVSDWLTDFSAMRTIRRLGHGSYGTVYLCEDSETPGKLLAIKTLNVPEDEDADFTEKFMREIGILIRF